MFLYITIYLYIRSTYPSIHLSIGLSIYLSVYLSIYPSIYLSIYLYIFLSAFLIKSIPFHCYLKGANARLPSKVKVVYSKSKEFCEQYSKKSSKLQNAQLLREFDAISL